MPSSSTVALAMSVTPRLQATLVLWPLGQAGAPNLAGSYVPSAIHQVSISGAADPVSGTLYTSGTASATTEVVDAMTGTVLLAESGAMTYDGPGAWHGDCAASGFPADRLISVVVRVYPTGGSVRVASVLLAPAAPVQLAAAAASTNRVAIAGVADGGVAQDSSDTAAKLTITDGAGTVIVNAGAMTYAAPNSWFYDGGDVTWVAGAVLSIGVAIYDQTGTGAQRGAVRGWATVTGPQVGAGSPPVAPSGLVDTAQVDIAITG